MKDLTTIQESVYEYLKEHLVENHRLPSYVEVSNYFEWASANAAYQHIQYLSLKGYIEYIDSKYVLAKVDIKLIKRRKK